MLVGVLWWCGYKLVELMGYVFIYVLGDWVMEYGVIILIEICVEYFLMENGWVVGVVVYKIDGIKVIVCVKFIFLIVGGFGVNMLMV